MGNIFQRTPLNPEYHSPTEGITLMAGNPTLDTEGLSEDLCKQIADSGCNSAAAVIIADNKCYPKSTGIATDCIKYSLNNCSDFGIKLFFSNGTLLRSDLIKSFVDKYKSYPALGGWFLSANLKASDLNNESLIEANSSLSGYKPSSVNTSTGINSIVDTKSGESTKYATGENKLVPAEALTPNLPVFLGINGDWERDATYAPLSSYPDYIAGVENLFAPSFWPFSYFPDLVYASNPNQYIDERLHNYYKALAYFSYIARYTSTPFWYMCRCQSFESYYNLKAPKPNERMLRGLVFSALAYGAQGIYYWAFCQSGGAGVGYANAPIDRNGNRTATFSMIQNINREVKAFNDVFFGCEQVETRLWAESKDWSDIKYTDGTMGPLMSVSCNSGSGYHNLLISHIAKEGKDNQNNDIIKDYLVIVASPFAMSPNGDSVKSYSFRLKFSDYWNVKTVKISGNGTVETALTNYDTNYTLYPGDYLVFRWE